MTTARELRSLLATNAENIDKLKNIVNNAVEQEKTVSDQLFAIQQDDAGFGAKMADLIASFGGSWKFIFAFATVFFVWIIVNTVILQAEAFDPYPFILLNLGLSTLAAIQAPVILMSQNRKEVKDRRREEDEYIINLKSEIEISNLHKKIDLLMLEQMEKLFEIQRVQVEMLQDLQKRQMKDVG